MRARIRSFFSRLIASLWPLRFDRDLNDEVQNHLSELEDRFVGRGFGREEARFAARRAFGGVDRLKEQQRDQRSFMWIEHLRQDVRYAYRTLSRDRAFATMAICTLALGIAAVTTMFTAVNTVLLRPLPYAEPDRLVQASEFYTRPRDGRVLARVPEQAVTFVLLIAMVNVASLKLSHAVTRAREVAIRSALGAGRRRLIRQFLVESMMISSVAGAFGLLLAYAGMTWLTQWMPRAFPRATEIGIDTNVFLFVPVVSIVVAIGFGIVPALTCSKPDLTTSLKDGARTASEGRSRRLLRHSMIVGEIALTTVLLTGAGLMTKSFWNVLSVPIGFDPERVVVAEFQFPCPSCETSRGINANPAQRAAFVDGMLQRLQNSPEVASVSFTTIAPLVAFAVQPLTIEDIPNDPQPAPMSSEITSEFFKTLAIPLESGRSPDPGEPAV